MILDVILLDHLRSFWSWSLLTLAMYNLLYRFHLLVSVLAVLDFNKPLKLICALKSRTPHQFMVCFWSEEHKSFLLRHSQWSDPPTVLAVFSVHHVCSASSFCCFKTPIWSVKHVPFPILGAWQLAFWQVKSNFCASVALTSWLTLDTPQTTSNNPVMYDLYDNMIQDIWWGKPKNKPFPIGLCHWVLHLFGMIQHDPPG